MTIIAGEPYTQLLNLNILGQLRVGGLPFGTDVIQEKSGDYSILVGDEFVINTANDNTFTLPLLVDAVRGVVIVSTSGTVTVDGNGSGITGTASVANGVSRKYIPASFGWVEVT